MELQETEYRKKLEDTLGRVESAFEDVDPDVAECEEQLGALTIRFADGARCILSAQPSVRQLWLAVAARGVAFHFNYDPESDQWVDDKGRGIELLAYLKDYIKEQTGLELEFS